VGLGLVVVEASIVGGIVRRSWYSQPECVTAGAADGASGELLQLFVSGVLQAVSWCHGWLCPRFRGVYFYYCWRQCGRMMACSV
jgi:hypothetical protein